MVVVLIRRKRPLHSDSGLIPVEGPPTHSTRRNTLPETANLFIVGVEREIDGEVVIVKRRERQLDGIEPHNTGIGGRNRLYRADGGAGQVNAWTCTAAQQDLCDLKHRAAVPRRFVEHHVADVRLGNPR